MGTFARSKPLVSVIVAARNEEGPLPGLIGSLAAQSIGAGGLEVVIVDNASSDRTAETARRHGAVVVFEPVAGRARARNRAVAAARGELLAFTDADCRPRSDWLEHLLPGLDDAELAGGPVRVQTGDPPSAIERFEALWRFPQHHAVTVRGWSATANLAIRRRDFERLGGFDPTFARIGEDVDLCLRAAAARQRIAWREAAIVEHPAERRLAPVLRRGFDQAVSLDLLHRRHGIRAGAVWRHPGPLVRGDWAIRRFGADPSAVPAHQRPAVTRVARAEYAARMAGSLWALWENRREAHR